MTNDLLLSPTAAPGWVAPHAAAGPAVGRRYAPARVRALFDAMAATYGYAAWLSGGLLGRWRRQLAARLLPPPTPGAPLEVVDLMAGGADLWPARPWCCIRPMPWPRACRRAAPGR